VRDTPRRSFTTQKLIAMGNATGRGRCYHRFHLPFNLFKKYKEVVHFCGLWLILTPNVIRYSTLLYAFCAQSNQRTRQKQQQKVRAHQRVRAD